jgi:hypothetical protein
MIRFTSQAFASAGIRLLGAMFVAVSLAPLAAAETADPPREKLCCAVPSGDEAPADHMIGQWQVTDSRAGLPLRKGERITFRRDGTMAGSSGTCRYAMLRGELTVSCGDETRQGTLQFLDDDKAVWHVDGGASVTIEIAE